MTNHPLPEYERRSALRAIHEYDKDYLGLYELAQICGVMKARAGMWRIRGKTPKADQELAMGPVWHRDTITKWLLEGNK